MMKKPMSVKLNELEDDIKSFCKKRTADNIHLVFEADINGSCVLLAYDGVYEDDDGNIVICASTKDMVDIPDDEDENS